MSSFVQFALSTFLAAPLVIAGLVLLRRANLPLAAAPVSLFPLTALIAWIVLNDDGSLGFIGVFGLGASVITPMRGLYELLKGLKQRREHTALSLLDERDRR